MRSKQIKKLLGIIGLLIPVIYLVYFGGLTQSEVVKKFGLQTLFGPVSGYSIAKAEPLDDEIVQFLELDDYTSVNYLRKDERVGLFIGYYFTLDKISAAHSPLVCFPGQGWTIGDQRRDSVKVGDGLINYAEIVAELNGWKELIIYWYQADEKTATEAFRNKINSLTNKLSGKKTEHAFVRVSVSMKDMSEDEARQIGVQFIQSFYPTFVRYIRNDI